MKACTIASMKIWFISSEYPPMFGGGIGTYVKNAADSAAEAGHEVVVFTRGESDSVIAEDNGVSVVRLKTGRGDYYEHLGYWTAFSYEIYHKLKWYMETHQEIPDIIEIQDYNAPGYYTILNKHLDSNFLSKTKIVTYLHTPTFVLDVINESPKYKLPNYWISSMEKFSLMGSDCVLSPSKFLKEEIKRTIPELKINVVAYPKTVFEEQNIWLNNPKKETNFLYLGRLEHRKGILQTLAVFRTIWQKDPSITLKVIGGDTFFYPKNCTVGELIRKKYQKQIAAGQLILQDSIKPELLKYEIQKTEGMILPSLFENFPYVAIEAMNCGSPLIVSQQGGQAELVGENQKAGFVFSWTKKGDLEKAIWAFLALSKNDKKRMSKEAFERVRRVCDPKIVTQEKIKCINKNKKKTDTPSVFPFINLHDVKFTEPVSVKSKKSLLSIIIPYYNLGDYLLESVESALASTYPNKEIIIVNDGTDDQLSLEILQSLRNKKLINVHIIDTENQGLAEARNVGAKAAEGEYLAFLDADNLVTEDFYERAIKIMEKYTNVSYVYSWLEYFDGAKGVWPTFCTQLPLLLVMNMLDALSVVRKDVFLTFGTNRQEMKYGMEDYDSWISLAENGHFGVSIPEPLLKYRVRDDSMSRQFNNGNILYSYQTISEEHPKLYTRYGKDIFNILESNGPSYLWNNPSGSYPVVGYTNGGLGETGIPNEHKVLFNRLYHSKIGQFGLRTFYFLRMQKILKVLRLLD